MTTPVMELRLGRCYTGTKRRGMEVVREAMRLCNVARNRMVEEWRNEVRKADSWEWQKPWSMQFYHRGRDSVPGLATTIVSAASQQIYDWQKSRVPYNHEGDAKKKGEACFLYETSLPTFRSPMLPAKRQSWKIVKTDAGYEFSITLFSKQSSNIKKRWTWHIETGRMSKGRKLLLDRIVSQQESASKTDYRPADSKIIFKRKGKRDILMLQLGYRCPTKDLGLDQDRVAVLMPAPPGHNRPFILTDPEGKSFGLGDGRPLVAGCQRYEIRRRQLRFNYRDNAGSGHGRSRFFRTLRPWSRSVINLQDRWTKLFVHHVLQGCIATNCGTLEYREPTKPLREKLWFAKKGVPINWEKLQSSLIWKLESQHGIILRRNGKMMPRLGMAEFRELFPEEEKEELVV